MGRDCFVSFHLFMQGVQRPAQATSSLCVASLDRLSYFPGPCHVVSPGPASVENPFIPSSQLEICLDSFVGSFLRNSPGLAGWPPIGTCDFLYPPNAHCRRPLAIANAVYQQAAAHSPLLTTFGQLTYRG